MIRIINENAVYVKSIQNLLNKLQRLGFTTKKLSKVLDAMDRDWNYTVATRGGLSVMLQDQMFRLETNSPSAEITREEALELQDLLQDITSINAESDIYEDPRQFNTEDPTTPEELNTEDHLDQEITQPALDDRIPHRFSEVDQDAIIARAQSLGFDTEVDQREIMCRKDVPEELEMQLTIRIRPEWAKVELTRTGLASLNQDVVHQLVNNSQSLPFRQVDYGVVCHIDCNPDDNDINQFVWNALEAGALADKVVNTVSKNLSSSTNAVSSDVDEEGVLDTINTAEIASATDLVQVFSSLGWTATKANDDSISAIYKNGDVVMHMSIEYDNGSLEFNGEQTVSIYLSGDSIGYDAEVFNQYLQTKGFDEEGEKDLDDVKPTLRELTNLIKGISSIADDYIKNGYEVPDEEDEEVDDGEFDTDDAVELDDDEFVEDPDDQDRFNSIMSDRKDFKRVNPNEFQYIESNEDYDFSVEFDDDYDVIYFTVHCQDKDDTEFINRVMGNAYKFSGYTGKSIMTLQMDVADLDKMVDSQIKKFDKLVNDEVGQSANRTAHAFSAELQAKHQSDPEQENAAKRLEKFVRTQLAPIVDEDPNWNSFFIDTPKEFKKYRLKTVGIMLTCYDMRSSVSKLRTNAIYKKMTKARKVVAQRGWQKAMDPDGNKCWMCIFIDAEYAKAHGRELLEESVVIKGDEYTIKKVHSDTVLLEGTKGIRVVGLGELLDLV